MNRNWTMEQRALFDAMNNVRGGRRLNAIAKENMRRSGLDQLRLEDDSHVRM